MNEHEHSPNAGAPSGSGSSMVKWILIGCGGLILLAILAGGGCVYFVMNEAKRQATIQVPEHADEIDRLLEGRPEAEEIAAAHRDLRTLAEEGKIGFLTFGVLHSVYEDIMRNDEIDDDEAKQWKKLVEAVVSGDGNIPMSEIQEYQER